MIKEDHLGKYTELISSGSTPKGGSDNYLDQGEILFIRSQNVLMNKFSDHDALYIPLNIHEKMKRTWVKNRDVLLNITGASIGRTTVYMGEDNKANVNQHVCIIRLKDFETVDPFYLSYFLASPSFQRHIMKINAGATRQALNFSQIGKFKIPIPPIQTQKKIVKIVKKAEKLKEWRAEANELADDYLESVFLDLFGDPLKNPNNWDIGKLGEICTKITDGTHHSPPNSENGDFPYITAKNIKKNGIILDNISYISKELHDEIYKRCDPKIGDVLYIKDGVTTGIAVVNDLDYEFSLLSSVALLKLGEKLNPYYLAHLLNSENMYRRIRYDMGGAAITRLTLVKIKKIKIPIPPIELQNQFASIVQQVESIKSFQSQSKQQIDNLFNTLMQKAFKGELLC